MKGVIAFDLPGLPPTANHAHFHVRSGRFTKVLTPAARRWIADCQRVALANRPGDHQGFPREARLACEVSFYSDKWLTRRDGRSARYGTPTPAGSPSLTAGDMDNRFKMLIDALQPVFLFNDAQIFDKRLMKVPCDLGTAEKTNIRLFY